MHDTGLKARLIAKGVRVVEIAGWQTRGSSTFAPIGAIHHHTAGGSRGATPSLATCIYGRPGLPGPLCQVMQSRESSGDDKAYLIACGKANHGGVGDWRGQTGNSRFYGLEVEHTGTGTVAARRHEITCRILAAMMEAPGSSRDSRMVCEHYEYAEPPGRKIDFFNLNPPYANRGDGIRARVAQLIGKTPTTPQDGFGMASLADLDKIFKANLDDIANYTWRTFKIDLNPANPSDTPDSAFVVLRDARNLSSRNAAAIKAMQADVDQIKAKLGIP